MTARRVAALALALVLLGSTPLAHAESGPNQRSVTWQRGEESVLQPPASAAEPSSETAPSAGTVSPAAAGTILSNDFEWLFAPFQVFGNGWEGEEYRKSQGRESAYCNGYDTISPPFVYKPNMDTWLVAGPYDLRNYKDAILAFDVWAETEVNHDFLLVGASTDGENFEVAAYSGSTEGEWLAQTVDVSEYCGSSQVWVAFAFQSDQAVQYEGVYIDRVSLTATPVAPDPLTPVYRFYNFTNGTHFYTPSRDERDSVMANLSNVYSYDGVAYSTSPYNNAQPLYRFYNRRSGGHFYTASPSEAADVVARLSGVFTLEGQTYSVNAEEVPESAPVYRFYNRSNGTHFYTASASERDMVMATWPHIYGYEGPAFWVGQTSVPLEPVNPIPGDLWQPALETLPSSGNYVYLESDPGDSIGAGNEYLYSSQDSAIEVTVDGGHLTVTVDGDEAWTGEFRTMDGVTEVEHGYYPDLWRYPACNPARGGMNWSGEGRSSSSITGWFAVDSVSYTDGQMTAIDLRFEQHAQGAAPALHGLVHWDLEEDLPPVTPVGPANAIPAALWRPVATSLPASGNYVYLDSAPGDAIGVGSEYLYTPSDASISVSVIGGGVSVVVDGAEQWAGEFRGMDGLAELQRGYYAGITRVGAHDPSSGGMEWSGEGRSSTTLTGWFAVDSVSYRDGVLEAIDLRFEQHSDGSEPSLHGAIHWRAEALPAGGPVSPIPDTLWQPAASALPDRGNYIYLDSDPGDYIGVGKEYLYTPANALIGLSVDDGYLYVNVRGNQRWSGDFQVMSALSELKTGYYPGVTRYPFHNKAIGGLDWSGEGRGENTLNGWFVIDSVSYTNGALTAVDIRFEQHGSGRVPALHGAIHWRADDLSVPRGPRRPAPYSLWQPLAARVPATGNYVYLDSDLGEFIGQGQEYLYTDSISVRRGVSGVFVSVGTWTWTGDFQFMNSLTSVKPGYYPNLMRSSFHNPAIGGMDWSGLGRGANKLSAWFVVDSITYTDGVITALDLRFEQHSEGNEPALHGVIHWRAEE